MRLFIRILAAPVVAALALFVNICGFLLRASAFILGILGTTFGLLGIAVLLSGAIKNGITVLVIAFIISPLGLPMAAAWLLGQVQKLRFFIQEKVFG